ncbi:MAG: glycogen-binding domain-containing protein [Desulfatibacillum sp.]|nr:glycogen-binding domain-containing protein [Desulfatibacillum sp.]
MAKKKSQNAANEKGANSSQSQPSKKRVTFSLEAPQATVVAVAGDFNGWDAEKHVMKMDKNGCWQKIIMVPPGRYEYKFLVDGAWMLNPNEECVCLNSFGSKNHVLEI